MCRFALRLIGLLALAGLALIKCEPSFAQAGSLTSISVSAPSASQATSYLPSVSQFHGGPVPIQPGPGPRPILPVDVGASIYLFSFQPTRNGEVPVSLLTDDGTGVVQKDAYGNGYIVADTNGNFDITGLYAAECPTPTAPIYLLALGGDIGYGENRSYAGMSAFPVACSQLPNVSSVMVNELTTVAAAYAFSRFPFTSADDEFSAPNTSEETLNYLIAYANDYVSGLYGTANSTTSDGGSVPVSALNSLADILSSCTQNVDTNACYDLLNAASTGTNTPSDVFMATLLIAQNPTNDVSGLYSILPSNEPYQPVLQTAPADWTLPLTYTPQVTPTLTLTSSEDPSNYGDPVTFTAQVTSSQTNVVFFYDGTTLMGSQLATGSGGNFVASVTDATLLPGALHQIIGVFNGAESPVLGQVVLQATPTVYEQPTSPVAYGTPITFITDILTLANSNPSLMQPSGTVSLYDGTTLFGSCGVSSIGIASCTPTTFLSVGPHTITAQYSGDSNYLPASTQFSQQILQVQSVTTLASTPASPVQFSQAVTFSATVSGGSPTGLVTFYDNGSPIQSPATVNGSGVAAILDSSLSVGLHTITASYSGDPGNLPSNSQPLQISVQQAPTATTVSLLSPSTYSGSPIVATVTVADNLGTSPSGSVTCSVSGNSTPFTGTLVNGSVSWSTPVMPIGTYTLSCKYPGSVDFGPSPSSPVSTSVIAAPQPTWTQNGKMTTPRFVNTATLLNDGTVLLAGGNASDSSANFLNTGEIYNPQQGTFTAITNTTMSNPRAGHTATLLNTGQVLLAGGADGSAPWKFGTTGVKVSNTADLYDPATRSFAQTGNMNYPRAGATATVLQDGTVLIVGGVAAPAEIYYSDGTFRPTGTPIISRAYHTATLLANGKVLIAGGLTLNSTVTQDAATSSAELYDPGCSCFTLLSSTMSIPREMHTATLLSSGVVVMIGGTSDGVNGLGTAEVYDPKVGPQGAFIKTISGTSTTQIGPMITARMRHTAAVLSNGMILVAGGANPTQTSTTNWTPIAAAESYNPFTGQFTSTVAMPQPTEGGSWVVLSDGTIMVAGGLTGAVNSPSTDATILSTVETYAPPVLQGGIDTKWEVLHVIYAPPGNASYATYQNSISQGTTITISNSFSNDAGISVSVGAIIGAWQDTATSSTDYTQSSEGTNSTTITKQSSLQLPITGVSDSSNDSLYPVNHDYDVIWLWLNPVATFTLDPNYPTYMTWNGYTYDSQAGPGMEVYPVYVGQLNGHRAFSQGDLDALSRSWDTNTWPAGQGPGLTQADFDQIITFDPFANCSFSNSSFMFTNCTDVTENTGGGNFTIPLQSSSTDNRFTLAPGIGQDIVYQQSISAIAPKPEVYMETTTNQTQDTTQTSHSQKQVFTLEEKYTFDVNILGLFKATLDYDLKESDTMTWTHTFTQSTTTTTMNTSSFSVAGPTCTVFGNGCNPSYAGPPEFYVYQDNLFGTFLFYPTK